eukprot:gene3217-6363_t
MTTEVGYIKVFELNLRFSYAISSQDFIDQSLFVVNKKKQSENVVSVPKNKIILDTAEEQAVLIPYSCRAGSCSSCLGKLKEGSVDQTGNIFLNDNHIAEGYVLTCVASPLSDCVIEVDIEDEFYNANPDMKVE